MSRSARYARRRRAVARRLAWIGRDAILILFAAICLLPIVWVWMSALKDRSEIFLSPFSLPAEPLFQNFVRAWTEGGFAGYFWNSVAITVPATVAVVALSTLAGYAAAKMRFPGRDALFLTFLFGLTIPFQAVMIPVFFTIRDLNLLNTYPGVILPMVAYGLPFGVFFMRAFFRGLPDELIAAARIDGCTEAQAFLRVMLPLATPGVLTLVVFQFMLSWNAYLMPLLFVNQSDVRPLTLGLMFFQGRFTAEYELIFAGITIITLPIILVYVALQRYFIRGLTAGALK